MGRTHRKYTRIYIGDAFEGFDLSGDVRDVGELPWEFETDDDVALSEEIMNSVIGHPSFSPGVVNAFMNADTNRIHDVLAGEGANPKILSIPVGVGAVPAAGDPAFCGEFPLTQYGVAGEGRVAVTLQFGMVRAGTPGIAYGIPWGVLLHPNGQETGANSANGVDDNGAGSTLGGFGVLHILATNGTATFSVQHASAAASGPFSTLLSFTLPGSSIGSEIVALSKTATVNRWLRWQVALGTATAITFVMSFVRGTGV